MAPKVMQPRCRRNRKRESSIRNPFLLFLFMFFLARDMEAKACARHNEVKYFLRENSGFLFHSLHQPLTKKQIQKVLCVRCFLSLWKNNSVSRKPCKQRSDLVLNGQMRVANKLCYLEYCVVRELCKQRNVCMYQIFLFQFIVVVAKEKKVSLASPPFELQHK